jgi:hypothetical protein
VSCNLKNYLSRARLVTGAALFCFFFFKVNGADIIKLSRPIQENSIYQCNILTQSCVFDTLLSPDEKRKAERLEQKAEASGLLKVLKTSHGKITEAEFTFYQFNAYENGKKLQFIRKLDKIVIQVDKNNIHFKGKHPREITTFLKMLFPFNSGKQKLPDIPEKEARSQAGYNIPPKIFSKELKTLGQNLNDVKINAKLTGNSNIAGYNCKIVKLIMSGKDFSYTATFSLPPDVKLQPVQQRVELSMTSIRRLPDSSPFSAGLKLERSINYSFQATMIRK